MKSIVYILIAIFSLSIFFSAIPKVNAQSTKTIVLQCTNKQYKEADLNKSADIIRQRLRTYGLSGFKLTILKEDNALKIDFQKKMSIDELDELLTSKGMLEFYETQNRESIVEKLNDDKLHSILSFTKTYAQEDPVLGTSDLKNKAQVENYLSTSVKVKKLEKDIKFTWSRFPNVNNEFNLYLLKKEPVLGGNFVASAHGEFYNGHSSNIRIKLTPEGAEKFTEITGKNINKVIAISIDNEVYSAPVVREEIKGGKCVISGNFSVREVNRLVALISHDILPLDFEIK